MCVRLGFSGVIDVAGGEVSETGEGEDSSLEGDKGRSGLPAAFLCKAASLQCRRESMRGGQSGRVIKLWKMLTVGCRKARNNVLVSTNPANYKIRTGYNALII